MHVWKWRVAESRLSAANDGPEHVGRWRMMMEDGGSAMKDDGKRQKTMEVVEDDGRCGSAMDNGRR